MPLAISSGVPMRSSSPDFDLGTVLLGLAAALRLLVAVELALDAVDFAVE